MAAAKLTRPDNKSNFDAIANLDDRADVAQAVSVQNAAFDHIIHSSTKKCLQ